MDIEAAMFDLDGTLIDSVPVYYRLMESILEIVGLPPVPKSVVAEFMIGGQDVWHKVIPEDIKDRKDALIEKCITVGREISANVFKEEVKLIPGVPEVFSLLSDRKSKIGVVTSTDARNIERKMTPLAQNGIKDMVDVVIGIDDVPRMKPAPDPLIECSRRLGVPVEKSLYVGDSHVDIRAGKAAGLMTVGVLTGLDDYETLKREDPHMILSSVSDLQNLFA